MATQQEQNVFATTSDVKSLGDLLQVPVVNPGVDAPEMNGDRLGDRLLNEERRQREGNGHLQRQLVEAYWPGCLRPAKDPTGFFDEEAFDLQRRKAFVGFLADRAAGRLADEGLLSEAADDDLSSAEHKASLRIEREITETLTSVADKSADLASIYEPMDPADEVAPSIAGGEDGG